MVVEHKNATCFVANFSTFCPPKKRHVNMVEEFLKKIFKKFKFCMKKAMKSPFFGQIFNFHYAYA